jgi:hypothetical protein
MRKAKFAAGLLSLMLACGAIAGNANRATLKFEEAVTVGGKQLPPGSYQVEWAGTGPDVELSISNNKGPVAKVPAQILPIEKALGTGYSTNTDQAGNKALTGIFLGGKKYELSIGGASAVTTTPSDKVTGSN